MRRIVGPLVIVGLLAALWMLFLRGNPGGISDARYSEFKQLAPPKLLYSCTRKPTSEALLQQARECAQSGRAGCDQEAYESGEAENATVVEFVGGQRTSTFDELLRGAKRSCAENLGSMGDGKFEVLEAVEN
ncbi:MAG: hypothetical protein WBM03_18055 [Steroidobacteraceae bacterium]